MKTKVSFLLGLLLAAVFSFNLSTTALAMQDLPEGSYQYTCVGCMRNLDMLNCNCPDDAGQIKPAYLHLAGCQREISNKNGKLVCGG